MSDMEYEAVDKVATIRLNRPAQRNAFALPMVDEWADRLLEAQPDRAVNAIVVTGAGTGFFADFDQSWLDDDTQTPFTEHIHRVPLVLQEVDKPVIAAIDGSAVCAGLNTALMCHLRLTSTTARMAMSYVKVGLVAGDGGCWLLPRLIGMPRALELLWTGDMVHAARAADIGLVNSVHEPDDLHPATYALAARLAAAPPIAMRMIKRTAYQSQDVSFRTSLELVSSHAGIVRSTEDSREVYRAFVEKRDPDFIGRWVRSTGSRSPTSPASSPVHSPQCSWRTLAQRASRSSARKATMTPGPGCPPPHPTVSPPTTCRSTETRRPNSLISPPRKVADAQPASHSRRASWSRTSARASLTDSGWTIEIWPCSAPTSSSTAPFTAFGFGLDAPPPGYDLIVRAVGGLMSVTGSPETEPQKVGVALVDAITCLFSSIGVMAAIRHRERTGEGQLNKIDLPSSVLAVLCNQAAAYTAADVTPQRMGNAHPSIAPYETLPTSDGVLAVAVGNDKQFRAMCSVIGTDALLDDARFATNTTCVANWDCLRQTLTDALSTSAAFVWANA